VLLYELIVLPVDEPMTADEAAEAVGRLAGGFQLGLRRDHRLDAFEERMEEVWPVLKESERERPFEFDRMRHHVFIGIPFESAGTVAKVVAEAAWSTGVAVFDPERHLVGLPAPMADAPMTFDDIAERMVATDTEE
jgi:hypothetical protein